MSELTEVVLPEAPASENDIQCLACGSDRHRIVDHIDGDDLSWAYRRDTGVAIGVRYALDYDLHRCDQCRGQWFEPVRAGDGGFYDSLQSTHEYYLADRSEYALARAFIEPGWRVLEVGAGSGAFGSSLSEVAYTGLELSEAAAADGQARGLEMSTEPVERFVANREGQFDVACAFQVIEHVERPAEVLAAMARSVRPGGLVIVSVPDDGSYLGQQVNNVLNMPPHHVTRWRASSIRAAGLRVGLRPLQVQNLPLEPQNTRSYAHTRVVSLVRRLTGRPHHTLDPSLAQPPMRQLIGLSARVLMGVGGLRGERPAGHTLFAVMEKPF